MRATALADSQMQKMTDDIIKTCFNCFWRTKDPMHCINAQGEEVHTVVSVFVNAPNVPMVCARWQWRYQEQPPNKCGKYFCAAEFF